MRRTLLLSVFALGTLASAQTYRATDVTLTFVSGPLSVAMSSAASPTLGAQRPRVSGGVAYVAASHGSGVWNVGLSPKLPLALTVKQESGSQDLNLRGLPLNRLNVTMTAGPLVMRLPSSSFTATVRQDTGSLEVHVPRDTGLRLNVQKFASGALRVDGQDIGVGQDLSGTYQTANFDAAKHKVTLNLSWGAGPVEVVTPGQ